MKGSAYPNPSILEGTRDTQFNRELLQQYLQACDSDEARKTHFFDGRFENVYLSDAQVPNLRTLKQDAERYAQQLLNAPIRKMGCWFNAMGPGHRTTLHSHDEDDELLSGVYYVEVPENSGNLIIHTPGEIIEHPPQVGQWVFFTPQTPHEVTENKSTATRLSIAFNFS